MTDKIPSFLISQGKHSMKTGEITLTTSGSGGKSTSSKQAEDVRKTEDYINLEIKSEKPVVVDDNIWRMIDKHILAEIEKLKEYK